MSAWQLKIYLFDLTAHHPTLLWRFVILAPFINVMTYLLRAQMLSIGGEEEQWPINDYCSRVIYLMQSWPHFKLSFYNNTRQ